MSIALLVYDLLTKPLLFLVSHSPLAYSNKVINLLTYKTSLTLHNNVLSRLCATDLLPDTWFIGVLCVTCLAHDKHDPCRNLFRFLTTKIKIIN
jgi:hypothetical protein